MSLHTHRSFQGRIVLGVLLIVGMLHSVGRAQSTDSTIRGHLARVTAGSLQEVRVALMLDAVPAGGMLPEAVFLVEPVSADCPVHFRRIEAPEGSLLHGIPVSAVNVGTQVMLRVQADAPLASTGLLLFLVYITDDMAEECTTDLVVSMSAFRSGTHTATIDAGRITVLPRRPRVAFTQVDAPAAVVWDRHAGIYQPDTCRIHVTVRNIGNEDARNVRFRLLLDEDAQSPVGDAVVPGSPADVPRDGGISQADPAFRVTKHLADSVTLWIAASFDNHADVLTSVTLGVPRSGPFLRYRLSASPLTVDDATGLYAPDPVKVTLVAESIGTSVSGEVTGNISLPPGWWLTGGDAPDRVVKTISSLYSVNASGTTSWELRCTPGLSSFTDTIRVHAFAANADTVESLLAVTRPAVDGPVIEAWLDAPDTLRFLTGGYAGNPFPVTVRCRNSGTRALSGAVATLRLPPDMVPAAAGDSLRRTLSAGTLAVGDSASAVWMVRYDESVPSVERRWLGVGITGAAPQRREAVHAERWRSMYLAAAPASLACRLLLPDSIHSDARGTNLDPARLAPVLRVVNTGTLPTRIAASELTIPTDELWLAEPARQELGRTLSPGDSADILWHAQYRDGASALTLPFTARVLDAAGADICTCSGAVDLRPPRLPLTCNLVSNWASSIVFDPVRQDYSSRVIDIHATLRNISASPQTGVTMTAVFEDTAGYLELDSTFADYGRGSGLVRHLDTLGVGESEQFTWRCRLVRTNASHTDDGVDITFRHGSDTMPEVTGDCRQTVLVPPVIPLDPGIRLTLPPVLTAGITDTALTPSEFPVTCRITRTGAGPLRISGVTLRWNDGSNIRLASSESGTGTVSIDTLMEVGDTLTVSWMLHARNVFARNVVFQALVGIVGSGEHAAVDSIEVRGVPQPAIGVSGSATPCPGDSIDLAATAGFRAYSWTTGSTERVIRIGRSGTYRVTVTAADNSTATATQTLVWLPAPEPSPITRTRNTLATQTGGSASQWLLNGWPIPGATAASIVVDRPGVYSVRLTGASGCVTELAPVLVSTLVGIVVPTVRDAVDVYPDPARDMVHVRIACPGPHTVRIELRDILGRIAAGVMEASVVDGAEQAVDIRGVPPGLYFLGVWIDGRMQVRSVRIQNGI